jgi:hypothetical protein
MGFFQVIQIINQINIYTLRDSNNNSYTRRFKTLIHLEDSHIYNYLLEHPTV